ncbi:MAG: O-antigen ligase family protein [Myxococcota bacterium]
MTSFDLPDDPGRPDEDEDEARARPSASLANGLTAAGRHALPAPLARATPEPEPPAPPAVGPTRPRPRVERSAMPALGPDRVPSWAILLVQLMWILQLFEPEWFLASFGGQGLFTRIPTLLTPLLLLAVAQNWRREALYWPFVIFLLLHVVHMPFVENRGFLMGGFKLLYHYFFMFLGTVCLMSRPSRMLWLLRMYMLCYAWFAVQGAYKGEVDWHTALANPDSYGPWMCMGLGYAYYYGMAVRDRRLKWASFLLAGLCLVGTVASLARGAVLAAAFVAGLIWIRSPRKLATAISGLVATVVVAGAVSIVHPPGEFIAEMETVSEGTEAGTGMERWVMWGVAWEVWKQYPILGTGPNNVGAVAAKVMPYDPTRPQYKDPVVFYAKKLHNIYMQILSEMGIVGATAWLVMLFDYFRRLRMLRRRSAIARWRAMTRGALDLHAVSLGLECAMAAYLVNGLVYNQIYIHWFWSLVAIVYVLSMVTAGPAGPHDPAGRRRRPGSPGPARPVEA